MKQKVIIIFAIVIIVVLAGILLLFRNWKALPTLTGSGKPLHWFFYPKLLFPQQNNGLS